MRRWRGICRRFGIGAGAVLLAACAEAPPQAEPTPLARWQHRTSELRELAFEDRVGFRWVTRAQFPKIVRWELAESYTPQFVARYRDAYAAMGLLPPDLDLLETLLELLGDQLVGLYSPYRRTLYVVREHEDERGGQSLMIVVHELVHALQHQHFPATVDLLQGLRHNDDVVLAIGSTVEGDASLTMLASDPNARLRREMEDALSFQRSMLFGLEEHSGMLARVPRLLRVSQIFPYAYGTPAAAEVYAEEGNRGLDAQLRGPALSTLRVRFPEEDHAVEFIGLPLEILAAELERRGCEIGHSNVAGMLTVRVFLEEYDPDRDPEALVRDWAGDRFVHVYCPDAWELAWLTRWTDAAAATDFARRYRAAAAAVAGSSPLSGVPRVIEVGRTVLVLTPGLLEHAELFIQGSEFRSYRSFGEWKADNCFPESPCPGL